MGTLKDMIDINDMIGQPWGYPPDPPRTYDCWAAIREVYSRAGIELPDYTIAEHTAVRISGAIEKAKEANCWKQISDLEIPCILEIRGHPGFHQHVGVYIGNNKFLHSKKSTGVVIERMDSPNWKTKIKGYWQYVG